MIDVSGGLKLLQANNTCADCGEKYPQWYSSNCGVFVCTICSGAHVIIGSQVSPALHRWTPDEINFIKQHGNARVNGFLEDDAGCSSKPNPTDTFTQRRLWIKQKYAEKRFAPEPPAWLRLPKDVLINGYAFSKAGFLQFKEMGQYHLRFCVLSGLTLHIYEHPADFVATEVVEIDVEAETEADETRLHFIVHSEDGDRFEFKADCVMDFNAWKEEISGAEEFASSPSGVVLPRARSGTDSGDTQRVLMQGRLLKRGNHQVRKPWKNRWFVLHKGLLRYWATRQDSVQRHTPLGEVSLGDGSWAQSGVRFDGKGYGIEVVVPGRTYYLSAPSMDIQQDWLAALHSAIEGAARAHGTPPSSSSIAPASEAAVLESSDGGGGGDDDGALVEVDGLRREGYLWKRAKHKKDWRLRWMVLTPQHTLDYYLEQPMRAGSRPKGSLPLHKVGAERVFREDKPLPPYTFTISAGTTVWLCHSDNDTEMDEWLYVLQRAGLLCRTALRPMGGGGEAHHHGGGGRRKPSVSALSPRGTRRSTAHPAAGSMPGASSCGGAGEKGLYRGYLMKQGNNVLGSKDWQRRWCVIGEDLTFRYYRGRGEAPAGEVLLLTCTVKPAGRAAPGARRGRQHAFDLVTAFRTYHFQAESAAECQTWLTRLREGVSAAIAALPDSPRGDVSAAAAKKTSGGADDEEEEEDGGVGSSADGSSSPLQAIRSVDGNDRCAECGSVDPEWASLTLGVVLCIECSGVHRSLGVHVSQVKSLVLDRWSSDAIAHMQKCGNVRGAAVWEAEVSEEAQVLRPTPSSTRKQREHWVRMKYQHKAFIEGGPGVRGGPSPSSSIIMGGGGGRRDDGDGGRRDGMAQVFKTGWLVKQGQVRENWKRRWFVLRDQSLRYYKAPGESSPAGTIAVASISSISVLKAQRDRPTAVLEICIANGRTLRIRDREEDRLEAWTEALGRAREISMGASHSATRVDQRAAGGGGGGGGEESTPPPPPSAARLPSSPFISRAEGDGVARRRGSKGKPKSRREEEEEEEQIYAAFPKGGFGFKSMARGSDEDRVKGDGEDTSLHARPRDPMGASRHDTDVSMGSPPPQRSNEPPHGQQASDAPPARPSAPPRRPSSPPTPPAGPIGRPPSLTHSVSSPMAPREPLLYATTGLFPRAHAQVVCEGPLWRYRAHGKQGKRWAVVVAQDALYEYSQGRLTTKVPLDSIRHSSVRSPHPRGITLEGRGMVYRHGLMGPADVSLHYVAESEAACQEWIDALQQCATHVARAATNMPLTPQKTGLLKKKGNARLVDWKTRAFVLRGRLLYYFKAEGDRVPIGVIRLGSPVVVKEDYAKGRCTLDISSTDGRVYSVQCSSVPEAKSWATAIRSNDSPTDVGVEELG